MRPSVGRKSGVHPWSAANIASRFSSSSPNAYCRSSVENRRAASASEIHPRSPSASFSDDDASASSLVPESARASTGVAGGAPVAVLNEVVENRGRLVQIHAPRQPFRDLSPAGLSLPACVAAAKTAGVVSK
jgi:hypothetical protein